MSTFWYHVFNIQSGVSESDCAAAMFNWLFGVPTVNTSLGGLYRSSCSNSWEGLTWRIQKVHPVRFLASVFVDQQAGAIASPALFSNTAGVITRRTEFSGRKQVSTLHMPGLPASGSTEGTLTAAQKTLYSALGDAIILKLQDGSISLNMSPSIVHKTNPLSVDTITNFVVQDTTRVMRRRTVGLGI